VADGFVFAAESGSAWSLLYPEFSVVVIRPLFQVPVGYSVALENGDLASFLSRWLQVTIASPIDERLYDHWILGENVEKRGPRWSVIREVLHWVD
jgi:hypothetical protein